MDYRPLLTFSCFVNILLIVVGIYLSVRVDMLKTANQSALRQIKSWIELNSRSEKLIESLLDMNGNMVDDNIKLSHKLGVLIAAAEEAIGETEGDLTCQKPPSAE